MKKHLIILASIMGLISTLVIHAETAAAQVNPASIDLFNYQPPNRNSTVCSIPINYDAGSTDAATQDNAVTERTEQENVAVHNPFVISFYKPTYILPYYYTAYPDQAVYQGDIPDNQNINHNELMFQISFKEPIWSFNDTHKLYLAYTQDSFWQAYQNSPFFRETDYQPELFLANQVNWHLLDGWQTNFFNIGALHESDGRGGTMERSWNRLYVEAISAKGNWLSDIQPWYIIKEHTLETYNPDIAHYLGYGQVLFGYKFHSQLFALTLENEAESGFSRGSETFTWSFPLWDDLRGYVLVFSGYGQSMIEYNHYTNSIGLGISLSDWI